MHTTLPEMKTHLYKTSQGRIKFQIIHEVYCYLSWYVCFM